MDRRKSQPFVLHFLGPTLFTLFLQDIRLGLNCVGGKETSLMAGLLGHNAHLVSYGAMSKQPLSLPTSLFIFKNLSSHGFWQSRWYKERSREERENLMSVLAGLMKDEKVCFCSSVRELPLRAEVHG
jgi:mitochondrial enoyl-[acyl-carrier protein] reductase / trans-2-enoyl-CoA reductase